MPREKIECRDTSFGRHPAYVKWLGASSDRAASTDVAWCSASRHVHVRFVGGREQALDPELKVTGSVGAAANAAVSAVITAAAVLAAGVTQAAALPCAAPRPLPGLATGPGGAAVRPSDPPPAASRELRLRRRLQKPPSHRPPSLCPPLPGPLPRRSSTEPPFMNNHNWHTDAPPRFKHKLNLP